MDGEDHELADGRLPSDPKHRTTRVKVALIGATGAGKTSLRNMYLTGRFSTSYKATIGCDFVTARIPISPSHEVSLACWDTAGQERFASLSSAFFRGSDAAIFVYDVTRPETLQDLKRWWGEFVERCPVEGIEAQRRFPCVVVGNKADKGGLVVETDARTLFEELIPPRPPCPTPVQTEPSPETRPPSRLYASISAATSRLRSLSSSASSPVPPSAAPSSPLGPIKRSQSPVSYLQPSSPVDPAPEPTRSIEILHSPDGAHSSLPGVPLSSTLYATPASSLSLHDSIGVQLASSAPIPPLPPPAPPSSIYSFATARSSIRSSSIAFPSSRSTSPAFSSSSSFFASSSSPTGSTSSAAATAAGTHKRTRSQSAQRSMSSASTSTIRPHHLSNSSSMLPPLPPSPSPSAPDPEPCLDAPEQPSQLLEEEEEEEEEERETDADGPYFFGSVSAKTGQGVKEVFEYVARRVVRQWETEEAEEQERAERRMEEEMAGRVDVAAGRRKKDKGACGC